MVLFQISSLAEHPQFVASLAENNSSSAGSSFVCSGKEEVSNSVIVEEVDNEN